MLPPPPPTSSFLMMNDFNSNNNNQSNSSPTKSKKTTTGVFDSVTFANDSSSSNNKNTVANSTTTATTAADQTRIHAIYNSAFLSTPEAQKFLPPDIHVRRVLRSRVLLLAMLLEKSVSERRLMMTSGVFHPDNDDASGVFENGNNNARPSPLSLFGNDDDDNNKIGNNNKLVRKDSLFFVSGGAAKSMMNNNSNKNNNNSQYPPMKQESKQQFKTALGEFADCCGKAEVEDVSDLKNKSRKSFAESYGDFLKM